VGASRFKQTEFGVKPVKVAGGAIKVKDEVRVEFDIFRRYTSDVAITGS
jgi:hypothetical protein